MQTHTQTYTHTQTDTQTNIHTHTHTHTLHCPTFEFSFQTRAPKNFFSVVARKNLQKSLRRSCPKHKRLHPPPPPFRGWFDLCKCQNVSDFCLPRPLKLVHCPKKSLKKKETKSTKTLSTPIPSPPYPISLVQNSRTPPPLFPKKPPPHPLFPPSRPPPPQKIRVGPPPQLWTPTPPVLSTHLKCVCVCWLASHQPITNLYKIWRKFSTHPSPLLSLSLNLSRPGVGGGWVSHTEPVAWWGGGGGGGHVTLWRVTTCPAQLTVTSCLLHYLFAGSHQLLCVCDYVCVCVCEKVCAVCEAVCAMGCEGVCWNMAAPNRFYVSSLLSLSLSLSVFLEERFCD